MANDNTMPADWAIEMALREAGYVYMTPADVRGHGTMMALARRIERTEQPPVDPLVEEAEAIRINHRDGYVADPILTAIRRGYELGKEAASK